MRFRVHMERQVTIEATVEAESEEVAEELVFTAWSDNSRPDGLLEFYEDDDPWFFEVTPLGDYA